MITSEELTRIIQLGLARIRAQAHPPRATYRVQFNPATFRFADATRLLPYLKALGISHLYAAPHLKSRSGSSHGYDVVVHGEINSELGTEEELAELHRALAAADMAMLLDWVPNHMAIGSQNPIWMDVLENGPSSAYARFFDIDWTPVKPELKSKVLVPILGDQYGSFLNRGELKLLFEKGAFTIGYWDHRFPVGLHGYAKILEPGRERLVASLGRDHLDVQEFDSILTAIHHLPQQTVSDPAEVAERQREKEVIKRRLHALTERSMHTREQIEICMVAHNGTAGVSDSFQQLHELLEMQAYRLAFWRVAAEQINYRRFFDVNELAALHMEDPEVFRHTHELLMKWIERGWIRALRIDHPDGLFDPREYLRNLQAEALLVHCRAACNTENLGAVSAQSAAVPWASIEAPLRMRCHEEVVQIARGSTGPLFIVVEKILGRKERLPDSWAVNGTTGYEFLCAVNGIFVDRESARELEAIYSRFVGQEFDFGELLYNSKKLILQKSLAGEQQMLAHRLERIAESDHRTRDFTLGSLSLALTEVIAAFPVYRTYVPLHDGEIDGRDRHYIEWAVDRARHRTQSMDLSVFDFIRDVLLKRHPVNSPPEAIRARLAFMGKFQQITSPAMAKGMEDTSFYIFNRLISQNEVGGEPERMGTSVDEFHAQNRDRLRRAPGSLLSTATHDTKRGEDVRLRIDALSEMPHDWRLHLKSWTRINRPLKKKVDGQLFPDRNTEYYFYQTLLGAWPGFPADDAAKALFIKRIQDHMVKAGREAKVSTSWTYPAADYETAVIDFVAAVISRNRMDPFWSSFYPFQHRLAHGAMQSSLSQVVLKVAAPGVPDFYQGCELWDLRLVDPDNRGPVDFVSREKMLREIQEREFKGDIETMARELARSPADSRIKLFVTLRSLSLRNRHPDLFSLGEYEALEVVGRASKHLVCFSRSHNGRMVVVVAGRLFATLLATVGDDLTELAIGDRFWAETAVILPLKLAGSRFIDCLTGRAITATVRDGLPCLDVSQLLTVVPVCLLELDVI